MKIISNSDTIHQIKIIPRKYAEITTAKITHELTDKTTILDFYTQFEKNGYLFFSFEFVAKSGNEYFLELYNNDDVIYRDWETDRKSTRLNSSHSAKSRMPSSA